MHARKGRMVVERGREKDEPGYDILGGEMIPCFQGGPDQEPKIVGPNYHEIFDN